MTSLPGRGMVLTTGTAEVVNIRLLDILVGTKLGKANTPIFSGFF